MKHSTDRKPFFFLNNWNLFISMILIILCALQIIDGGSVAAAPAPEIVKIIKVHGSSGGYGGSSGGWASAPAPAPVKIIKVYFHLMKHSTWD